MTSSSGACRRCRSIPKKRAGVFGNPFVLALGTAGETACPTLLAGSIDCEVGGAGGFACLLICDRASVLAHGLRGSGTPRWPRGLRTCILNGYANQGFHAAGSVLSVRVC